jgi:hypothetical protein
MCGGTPDFNRRSAYCRISNLLTPPLGVKSN